MKFIFKTIFFGMIVSLMITSFTWMLSLIVFGSLHIFRYDISPTAVFYVACANIGIGTITFIAWLIYLTVQAGKGFKIYMQKAKDKGEI